MGARGAHEWFAGDEHTQTLMGMRPFADCWWSSIRNVQTQLCCGSQGGFCIGDTLGMTPREMRLYLDSLLEWQDDSRVAAQNEIRQR